ncbi:4-hydroxythreonine-4-phosphate dehydrogenase PdxA [Pseudaestuariivita atlantica]|uniref:4-hydroxythreonine-4-phosphate dehydrogenase n=1 Tax=Pseudaestuariivita atlantica TaxID=1317121 RepID=A0A0L1JKT1_9RHOB|nr:4-hydroxythreonine-4-phosphate dehydrogenase PdxA [Pseudaestuariivita atlantica]KNG92361.1 4-hydroxythreonine-4-phosphate dehydrogenase [Pseudaestuariivita atlantica]
MNVAAVPPVVAVSCGDPSGIGPELAVKARAALGPSLPFVWIGDPAHLPHGAAVAEVTRPADALSVPGDHLPVMPLSFAAPARPGKPDPANAAGVIASIDRAVALVRQGEASAVCTLPIAKKVLQDGAGFAYPGHTEYLAALGGVERSVMMLASDRLRLVPVTIHIPLAEVPAALTPELLEDTLRITASGLAARFGIARPRIAVAGLNPHAGEGGKMGREEIDLIAPVLDRLRAEGMDLTGPLPADTMFHAAARAGYDVAVCMYHDQALIPIKALDFDRGVNVTLGLPFVRTSPDHGTAFDIAGQDRANPSSTIEALKLAARMSGSGS